MARTAARWTPVVCGEDQAQLDRSTSSSRPFTVLLVDGLVRFSGTTASRAVDSVRDESLRALAARDVTVSGSAVEVNRVASRRQITEWRRPVQVRARPAAAVLPFGGIRGIEPTLAGALPASGNERFEPACS